MRAGKSRVSIERKSPPMKKALGGVIAALVLLAACGSDGSTSEEEAVDTAVMEEVMAGDIVAIAS